MKLALHKYLSVCQLDLRSLAIFRMGLASNIILIFLNRFNLIADNYSDRGTLSRSELINTISGEYWSLNFITGSVLGQQILFLIAICAAMVLLIGYRTKVATIVCWVMLLSLHNRNLSLVNGSEDIIRIIAFWAMFLPLGAYYSSDRALDTNHKPLPHRIISGGMIGFIIQIVIICLFDLDQLDSTALLLILLAFIPSYIWNLVSKKTCSKAIAGLIINYDRDCGFCKKIVCFLHTFLILPGVTIREAQENLSICADMEKYNSWVIEDYRGDRYYKWYGIVYIVSISPILFWLAPILRYKPLMQLGNNIYEFIANNRRLMGNFTKPFLFRPQNIKPSILTNSLALLCLALILFKNIAIAYPNLPQTETINSLLRIVRLDS